MIVCILAVCVALFAQLFSFVLIDNAATDKVSQAAAAAPDPYDKISSETIYDEFRASKPGIFIVRQRELIKAGKIFAGTVFAIYPTAVSDPTNFIYTAMVKEKDKWVPADKNYFWTVETSPNISVKWYLREDAPANTYGIHCLNGITGEELYYQIIYTEQFTFVSTAAENGENIIRNFYGGTRVSVTFSVAYNGGAVITDAMPPTAATADGFKYGNLISAAVIEASTFEVEVTTLAGVQYSNNNIILMGSQGEISLWLVEPLTDETYIVKLFNNIDKTVYGIFVIENAESAGLFETGIWAVLLIFGLFLVVMVCLLYFTPVLVRRINESRLYNENLRIKREKNPEEYAEEKSQGFLSGLKAKMEEAKARREGKVIEKKDKREKAVNKDGGGSKFSQRLQESMQVRQYAKEHGLTRQQIDEAREEQKKLEQAKIDSFAFLRDYDKPIAELKKEEEEDRSINAATVNIAGVAYSALEGEEKPLSSPIEITSASNINTSSGKEEWVLSPEGTMVLKNSGTAPAVEEPKVDASKLEDINIKKEKSAPDTDAPKAE
jgi:hypothetical protein